MDTVLIVATVIGILFGIAYIVYTYKVEEELKEYNAAVANYKAEGAYQMTAADTVKQTAKVGVIQKMPKRSIKSYRRRSRKVTGFPHTTRGFNVFSYQVDRVDENSMVEAVEVLDSYLMKPKNVDSLLRHDMDTVVKLARLTSQLLAGININNMEKSEHPEV